MSGCCTDYVPSPEEVKRKADEEAAMNKEVSVNGGTFKIKDLFPDHWAARDFIAKLNLIEKAQGGKAFLDTGVESMMDDTPDSDDPTPE